MTIDDNENNNAVASVEAPASPQKRKYKPREAIFKTRFTFTDDNIARAKYIIGKKYDRRFDDRVSGLCIHLRPNGVKTFYAFKSVNMYNKKQNKWAPNVVYKKMFHWAKNTGFRAGDARDKVSEFLSNITESRTVSDDDVTIEYLVKKFIKTGLTGFTLRDESRFYKEDVIKRYKKILNSYILFENCTDLVKKKHTAPVQYQNTIYSKPFKAYKASELTKDAIEAFKFKMKDTPQVANTVIALLSVVYNWSKQNKLFRGENPFLLVKRYPKVRVKKKLPDDKRDQIKDYCESKAFDYNPHFLTMVAMVLYTGFRGKEMFGLRWQPPITDEQKNKCSGWLEPGWDNENEKSYLFLWDPKNRKEFRAFLRLPLKRLLKRLRKKLYNDQKVSWCLKSDYIFPKTRWKDNFPEEHTDAHAIAYPLRKLNEDFGLRVESNGRLRNFFTIKIGRKTFGSQVAQEKGVEVASRALNHSDTQVTRDHYIVPEEKDLEFEFDDKKSNVENIDKHRLEKVKKLK